MTGPPSGQFRVVWARLCNATFCRCNATSCRTSWGGTDTSWGYTLLSSCFQHPYENVHWAFYYKIYCIVLYLIQIRNAIPQLDESDIVPKLPKSRPHFHLNGWMTRVSFDHKVLDNVVFDALAFCVNAQRRKRKGLASHLLSQLV